MGKKDTITKKYMKNPCVFADVFNKFLYRGERRIRPEQLRELDTAEIAVPYGSERAVVPEQKYRDILKLMMTDDSMAYCILGVENQSDIHYAMPVRNLVYDAMQLAYQVSETAASHRRKKANGKEAATDGESVKKPSGGEYLGGFYKTDRLIPVVTLVLFFSAKEWDGPLSLREMYVDADETVMQFVPDYKVNLVAPYSMSEEEIAQFHTSFRELMLFIKYSGDKKKLQEIVMKDKHFHSMERDVVDVINVLTDSKLTYSQEEENVDMCKAILDMRNESRQEGRKEGYLQTLIGLVCKKMAKNNSVEEIADMLEETPGTIQRICDVAVKYAPEYDVERIYEELVGEIF